MSTALRLLPRHVNSCQSITKRYTYSFYEFFIITQLLSDVCPLMSNFHDNNTNALVLYSTFLDTPKCFKNLIHYSFPHTFTGGSKLHCSHR